MSKKAKNRPPSLLDSKYYQNALRFNQIENNKLDKTTKSLESDNVRTSFLQRQDWENTQLRLIDLKKTSGKADLEKYNKLLSNNKEKEDETTPQYYFMYGMRIGERPQLLKNFLGKSKAKTNQVNQKEPKDKNNSQASGTNSFLETGSENNNDAPSGESDSKLNQIVIDGKIVTQYPIGYSKSCVKKQSSFISCTNVQLKVDRERKPLYYLQKHKYVIPPVNMFR